MGLVWYVFDNFHINTSGWHKISERKVLDGSGFPYFDDHDQLQLWDVSPSKTQPTNICGPDSRIYVGDNRVLRGTKKRSTYRATILRKPRVDKIECSERLTDAPTKSTYYLLGLDENDAETWSRPRTERLTGATPSALVLSTLEVISPETGETIFPAPPHTIDEQGKKQLPHKFFYETFFMDQEQSFLTFHADVILLWSQGGLYQVNPRKNGSSAESVGENPLPMTDLRPPVATLRRDTRHALSRF